MPDETTVAALAEVLSWTSGEFTRYSTDAHPDHNRWSWRGDGHGEALREGFREQARALLASPALADLLRAERVRVLREAANAWPQGGWSDVMLPKPKPPAVPVIAYANGMGDWLRARAEREAGA